MSIDNGTTNLVPLDLLDSLSERLGEGDGGGRTQWGGGAASGIVRRSKRKEDQMDEAGREEDRQIKKMIKEAVQEKEREGSKKRKLESEEGLNGEMDEAVEEEESDEEIDIHKLECLVGEWVAEVESQGFEKDEAVELEEDESIGEPLGDWEAWDDVHGGVLPIEEVRRARKEEVTCM